MQTISLVYEVKCGLLPAVFEFLKAWDNSLESQEPLGASKAQIVYDLVLMMLTEPKISLKYWTEVHNDEKYIHHVHYILESSLLSTPNFYIHNLTIYHIDQP